MIDRLQRSIRQITKELDRLQALRVKMEIQLAPAYPTKQSQLSSKIDRRQADLDDLEE
jgi:hypothetical protein